MTALPHTPGLTPKMLSALQTACGFGLYHEFSNTSTVNALRRRGLLQSDRSIGWYVATDKGRAAIAKATEGAE
jgi:hypothetical protein